MNVLFEKLLFCTESDNSPFYIHFSFLNTITNFSIQIKNNTDVSGQINTS